MSPHDGAERWPDTDRVLSDPERLAALDRTGLLDGPPEEAFERLTRLACSAVGAPVALVSLIDGHRQFFTGSSGLPEPLHSIRQTPLSHSFCRHVVVSGEALIVPDTRADSRVSDNPAIEEMDVAAYAGVPIHDDDGHVLGSMCVIDTQPRAWTTAQLRIVQDLAGAVEAEIRLRRALRDARAAQERLSMLAEVGVLLTERMDETTMVDRLARFVVGPLADICMVDLLEPSPGRDSDIRLVTIRAVDPEQEARVLRAEKVTPRRLADRTLVAQVLRTGQSRLQSHIDDAYIVWTAADDEHTDQWRAIRPVSAISVPLIARGTVLGALSVLTDRTSGRHYDAADTDLVAAMGRRMALAIDNARLNRREHQIAETLQRSLLPVLPRLPPGVAVAVRYLPGGDGAQVGGDWYDLLTLPDGAIGVAIGDVMGHDLAATAAMGQLRSVLRSCAWEGDPPARVLDRMDTLVQGLEMADLATAIYARIEFEPDGPPVLRYANAGHLPPLLLEPDGSARFLDGGRSVLLGSPFVAARADASESLPWGGTLLLYTDGLVEVRGESLTERLELLRRAFADVGAGSPNDLCDRLLAALVPGTREDDVAMLALRLTAPPSS